MWKNIIFELIGYILIAIIMAVSTSLIFKTLYMLSQTKRKIYIFHYWKNQKKLFILAIISLIFTILVFFASAFWFVLDFYNSIVQKSRKPYQIYLSLFLFFLIFWTFLSFLTHIKIIIRFVKTRKEYKNELFNKSLDNILAFDDSKYPYELKWMTFFVENKKFIMKINTQISIICIARLFSTKKHFLKFALLRMINIAIWNSQSHFDSFDDQYYFIMKKFIAILQKDFHYSIEQIREKYNDFLGVDEKNKIDSTV
ncbi:hypothetical protein ACJA25_00775 [Mycoplasmopsis hyopharyngis]|uniref:hypothetical protein n=1 Tax=Mycoplasmopsis hyopharyngis TaxID=29558 RepID=UPI0038739570